ncbi:MAG: exonuclease domain-containing protein [Oricola sp.]
MTAEHTVFLAVDVETANPDPASICWLGLALFRDGELAQTWSKPVDCGQPFDPAHTSREGLTRKQMKEAVPLRAVLGPLYRLTAGRTVVSLTKFEKVALALAAEAAEQPRLDARWLDVSVVARRTWEEVALRGNDIPGLCAAAGIDAENLSGPLDRAIVCGHIMAAACRKTGLTPKDWCDRIPSSDIWDAGRDGGLRKVGSG